MFEAIPVGGLPSTSFDSIDSPGNRRPCGAVAVNCQKSGGYCTVDNCQNNL